MSVKHIIPVLLPVRDGQFSSETLTEITCTGWVFVEEATPPCVNELERKGWMISTTGVDGLIPKHWVTFILYVAISKKERLRQSTITPGRNFRGRYQ
jgi:hypothetical protein